MQRIKHNILIWNKLIKKEIFLKAYKIFENYIYYKKWNYYEDNIWSLLVNKLASSKMCVKKLIYRYNDNINKKSIMNIRGLLIEYTNIIYRFEMVRKFLNENIYFQHISYECESLIKIVNDSEIFRGYIQINNYLKNLTYIILLTVIYFTIS